RWSSRQEPNLGGRSLSFGRSSAGNVNTSVAVKLGRLCAAVSAVDLDAAIHVAELDAGSARAERGVEIRADPAFVNRQVKVAANAATHGAGTEMGVRIFRHGELHATVHAGENYM